MQSHQKYKPLMIAMILVLCVGLVAATWVAYNLTMQNAGEVRQFNDTMNNKTLAYTTETNQSVYIEIPANAILTHANLTVEWNE